jgi:sugar phosphate isomerase/epimerase
MLRPITIFTGQWADIPVKELAPKMASLGYQGLELACWGDHFNIQRALQESDYCAKVKALLAENNMQIWAISNHLPGQMILDPNDRRSDDWAPAELAGNPEGKRQWAIQCMKDAARAAQKLGVGVVNGFTGSSIWHWIYPFPPVSEADIQAGYDYFAKICKPIFDVFADCGVKFALEVHPTEIAFDLYSAHKALEAVDYHPAFGFNFDPSHLLWQGVDPVQFIYEFPDRIFHVHMKDVKVKLNGRTGILSSHLQFGDPRRGWDFRSLGHGDVNFPEIIRALNNIGYNGPLSVEWEDNGLDRFYGAKESCEYLKKVQFEPAEGGSFEDAFKH